jgi:hypothetical protein
LRGGRRPGAGRKPGQLSKRTIDDLKRMGPAGERALAVLVSARWQARVADYGGLRSNRLRWATET